LIAACDASLDRLPSDDPGSATLRADVASFRDGLLGRLELLDAEGAA
jgi:hypothetical protein